MGIFRKYANQGTSLFRGMWVHNVGLRGVMEVRPIYCEFEGPLPRGFLFSQCCNFERNLEVGIFRKYAHQGTSCFCDVVNSRDFFRGVSCFRNYRPCQYDTCHVGVYLYIVNSRDLSRGVSCFHDVAIRGTFFQEHIFRKKVSLVFVWYILVYMCCVGETSSF